MRTKILKNHFFYLLLTFSFLPAAKLYSFGQSQKSKPNVLWILIENIGPEFSCYNYPNVKTPNIDRLASDGVIYKNAFTNAPVCSPSRSSLILGMYPNAIGVHQHRSRTRLPDSIKTIPEIFQKAGYYTSLGNGYRAKTDYNFNTEERNLWNGNDWAERVDKNQPFFAQLTITHSHRGSHWHNPYDSTSWLHKKYIDIKPVNPDLIKLPEIIPDNIFTRDDWAKYLNQIQVVDYHIGEIINRLKQEGIYDNTLIVLMGDNGRDHLRNEYWLYDGGIHVPLIIRWEGEIPPNSVNNNLVSGIDISVSLLKACGIPIPSYMQGAPFLGNDAQVRDYVYASRDRIDDAFDMVRSVRSKKYKYIRNFMPNRSYSQHRGWLMHVNPAFSLINYIAKLAPEELNTVQKQYTASVKPIEEFYDIINDPEELVNLADNPDYQKEIQKFRILLKDWMLSIDDKARIKEIRENVREESFKDKIVFPTKEEQYNHSKLEMF